MKIIDTLRQRVHTLLTAPGEELGRWGRFVRYQIQLWRFCLRRLHEHNAAAMSAALSFRTVFALVPALVLAMLVMKPMGLAEEGRQSLREVLTKAGFDQLVEKPTGEVPDAATMPTTAPANFSAADKIEQLVLNVEEKLTFKALGPVGAVLLIWSALSLMMTMEGTLNRVFGAARSRAIGRRVFLYWSVLTLGPVLLAATSFGAGKVAEVFAATKLSWVLAAVEWISPPVVAIVLLGALYKLLPNARVAYRAALGGAAVAVPLWMVAKWAFSLYAMRVGAGSLYGALGLVPMFLLWLNLCWLIFLFGAELASTASNLERMRMAELAESIPLGPSDLLAAVTAVASGYADAEGAVTLESVAAKLNLPEPSVRSLLDRLDEGGLVVGVERAGADAYVLAVPAEHLHLADVMDLGHRHGAVADELPYAEPIARAVNRVRRLERKSLGEMTLADMLAIEGPK